MNFRFVLEPGWVTGATDGGRHYLDAFMLARLYGVQLKECTTPPAAHMPASVHAWFWQQYADLPRLAPRRDGDYRVPS